MQGPRSLASAAAMLNASGRFCFITGGCNAASTVTGLSGSMARVDAKLSVAGRSTSSIPLCSGTITKLAPACAEDPTTVPLKIPPLLTIEHVAGTDGALQGVWRAGPGKFESASRGSSDDA